jgi:2-aminoadipate transaminase
VNDYRLARRASALPATLPESTIPAEIDPGTICFDSGFAFPPLFPDLSGFAAKVLTDGRDEALQYSNAQGRTGLRGWIADRMNDDGCRLGADDILITNGAKNGIDLVCRLLLDEGDTIVVTAPTYFTAIPIFRSFGVELLEVAQDEHGMRVDRLAERLASMRAQREPLPKFIYNVPDFHNPSGLTMPLERRRALVALAAEYNVPLVEDAPYRRVRFEGDDVASLKALDTDGRVIHLGTFSKLIAPGLRVGWIASEQALVSRLMRLKCDGGTSALLQGIVYDFCRSDAFDAHVQRVRDTYRQHRDTMIAALRRDLPGVEFLVPEGGYYVWLTLPAGIDADEVAAKAGGAGVQVLPGSKFFANVGTAVDAGRYLRLSYSYSTPRQISAGIGKLAGVLGMLAPGALSIY